ncbi:cupin domain-containing protein [Mucilaginibacter sp. X5P1]|uniref:cupin domain-containing protein n=1 Tax=Mucilaginibacter sp. X5P1 TaxID=2723088 RepID=UPI0016085D7E|nr:cupin domain-containing protein [Mucilaginibacter sp. X5P1]MBB6136616.1 quercetin dioxygenase-like cupin family protein [Mucilaginibacter sp. X5P1]
MTQPTIIRKHLLTATLGARQVTSVEIKEITFDSGQKAGLHLHPCPVTGYIVAGTAIMQIAGQEPLILKTGDAFYEPADTHIIEFSNYSAAEPMTFIAFYLLNGDQELIKML